MLLKKWWEKNARLTTLGTLHFFDDEFLMFSLSQINHTWSLSLNGVTFMDCCFFFVYFFCRPPRSWQRCCSGILHHVSHHLDCCRLPTVASKLLCRFQEGTVEENWNLCSKKVKFMSYQKKSFNCTKKQFSWGVVLFCINIKSTKRRWRCIQWEGKGWIHFSCWPQEDMLIQCKSLRILFDSIVLQNWGRKIFSFSQMRCHRVTYIMNVINFDSLSGSQNAMLRGLRLVRSFQSLSIS